MKDLFDVLFRLGARNHELPAAAAAFKLEIHSGAEHGKLKAAARVLFLHRQDVAYTDVQNLLPLS